MLLFDPFKRYSVIHFYHFTDRCNLDLIRELGGLYSFAKLRELGVEPPIPGGNDWSQEADILKGLDRYIHLCFRANHPMEHVAHQDGRLKNPIFLYIHVDVISWDGVMFTDDVSNKSGVETHTINEAKKLIDFQILYTRTDWGNSEIQVRLQQAEKYEILVPDHIPLKYIRNLPDG